VDGGGEGAKGGAGGNVVRSRPTSGCSAYASLRHQVATLTMTMSRSPRILIAAGRQTSRRALHFVLGTHVWGGASPMLGAKFDPHIWHHLIFKPGFSESV
jgi:hypothetical protein